MIYKDYIQDRRVIFVGACPNIKGLGGGDFIDAFDVVVRTNGSICLMNDKEYQEDYGSRCDVLYTNNQFYREMRPLPVMAWKKKGLKHLCMKTCKPNDMREYSHHVHARRIIDAINKVNQKVPSALMGTYIYQDIIDCKPKELFITGIDFFISKKKIFEHDNYQEYLPGYLPEVIRNQGNKINKGKTADGHDIHGNTRYIYKLWKSGEIRMPSFIEKIMIGIVEGRLQQK